VSPDGSAFCAFHAPPASPAFRASHRAETMGYGFPTDRVRGGVRDLGPSRGRVADATVAAVATVKEPPR
jgi:hypothetical protein